MTRCNKICISIYKLTMVSKPKRGSSLGFQGSSLEIGIWKMLKRRWRQSTLGEGQRPWLLWTQGWAIYRLRRRRNQTKIWRNCQLSRASKTLPREPMALDKERCTILQLVLSQMTRPLWKSLQWKVSRWAFLSRTYQRSIKTGEFLEFPQRPPTIPTHTPDTFLLSLVRAWTSAASQTSRCLR